MKKTRLNKQELMTLVKIQERIDAFRRKVDEDMEISLMHEENGTIGSNLDCASCSIEMILQEYDLAEMFSPKTTEVVEEVAEEAEETMRVIDLAEIQTKDYDKNCDRWGDDGCIICGRPLNEKDMKEGKFLHLMTTGDLTDSQVVEDGCSIDQGWFQVGCTCYKNFLKAASVKPVKVWKQEVGYTE